MGGGGARLGSRERLTWLLLKAWAVSLLRPHCEQTKSPADLRQSLPLSATSGRYVASIPARLLPLLTSVRAAGPRPLSLPPILGPRNAALRASWLVAARPGRGAADCRGNGSGGVEHRPARAAAGLSSVALHCDD